MPDPQSIRECLRGKNESKISDQELELKSFVSFMYNPAATIGSADSETDVLRKQMIKCNDEYEEYMTVLLKFIQAGDAFIAA